MHRRHGPCARDGRASRLPGVAPVAKQQGVYVAKLLTARARDATCRRSAIATSDHGHDRPQARRGRARAGHGFPAFSAWVIWCFAHVYFLIGFRNRLVRADELGLELPDLPARHAADHRRRGSRMEDMAPPQHATQTAQLMRSVM